MAEPEDVILEGAHAATTIAARLWSRHRTGPPRVELREVRTRLELLVGGLFGVAVPIVPAAPTARPSFAARVVRRLPRHLLDDRPVASTDAARIRLPPALPITSDREASIVSYRLLAVEQAARVSRGTPAAVTAALAMALPPDVLDLFLLCEAVAVDWRLSAELPGLATALGAARRDALASRPSDRVFTPREWAVESLIRAALAAPLGVPPDAVPLTKASVDSLTWARTHARTLAALPGRYRGIPAVPLWGRLEPRDAAPMPSAGPAGATTDDSHAPDERVRMLRRRPRIRAAADDEDDASSGMWMIQLDEPQEHVEDPMGLQRPADRDHDADADDLADSLSELPEARLVTTPGTPAEVLASTDPPPRRVQLVEPLARGTGIAYPEWDYRVAAYHPGHAVVREHTMASGDPEWVRTVLRRHAAEVQRVRRRFERLRPRRVRVGRQFDGSDVDIGAYVASYADTRAGHGGEARLYETVRTMRRDIAISVVVDISASTDSWLSGQQRIIDVEKEAVLLLSEALDALGDRYAITAFSGHGPASVALVPVKRFGEVYDDEVRRRIAGLEPDRYTRMGAALRHTTALLARESAHHRLLVLLTDGKPNDVDLYEGRYGIEDTRQAVAEACLQGLHPFCLTVDREAPTYLPRLFGAGSYAVLRRVETLPLTLVEVVRRLLRG